MADFYKLKKLEAIEVVKVVNPKQKSNIRIYLQHRKLRNSPTLSPNSINFATSYPNSYKLPTV